MPSNNKTDEPLVRIATAPNEPTARMWAEILDNNGIHYLIKGEDLGAAMYIPSLLSHCRIYVLASQADQAKEILAPFLDE